MESLSSSQINTGIAVLLLTLLIACSEHKDNSTASKEEVASATSTKNLFVDKGGKRIAYRVMGSGQAMILCNRFRGTMDDWDPLFLDSLAQHHTIVTFDYTGIGLSIPGDPTDSLHELDDVADLASHLKYDKFILVGWSHGGKVAQVFTARYPEKISHLVLLGTGPIGKTKWSPEQVFFDRALKPINDFDDEVVLFFEPEHPLSVEAARLSHGRMAARVADRDVYVTPDKFEKYFASVANYNADEAARARLKELEIPILALSGDHDIVFPVESWYDLTHENPNLQIMMLPRAGHGPHSQYPVTTAAYIRDFIGCSGR